MRASAVFARLSAILIVTALVSRVARGRNGSDLKKALLIPYKLQRPDLGLVTPGRSGSVSESKDSLSQIRNPQYTTLVPCVIVIAKLMHQFRKGANAGEARLWIAE